MQIKVVRLFDVFVVCLSQEFVFVGFFGKFFLLRFFLIGYLYFFVEFRVGNVIVIGEQGFIRVNIFEVLNMRILVKELYYLKEYVYGDYEVLYMFFWFVNIGSEKLYQAFVGIFRFVGLFLIVGNAFFFVFIFG